MNFLLFDVYMDKVGGVNEWVESLSEEIINQGHEVKRLSFYGNKNSKDHIYLTNDLKSSSKILSAYKLISFSQRKFNEIVSQWLDISEEYIIIVTYPLLSKYIIRSGLNNKTNLKILQFHSDKQYVFEKNDMHAIVHRYYIKKNIPKFDLFSAYTNIEEKYMNSLGYSNTMFIGNSIKKLSYPEYKDKKILFISRLDKGKNCDLIVELLTSISNDLRNTGFHADLNIYYEKNNSESEKEYNSFVELINTNNYSDVIKIQNGTFGEEKEIKLSQSDIMLGYSDFEGMPIVFLEAQSHCSIPISNLSTMNIKEIIDDEKTGYIVDSIDEMKKVILQLINNPDKIKQIQNNIKNNRDHILVSSVVSKLINDMNNYKNKKI